ncbi:hypothetical protein EVAR_65909_1 [Eumeta japonica]|uniref:Uncharacterized protein n=1 Tax=Eumeta variegata TaxID=151549 RepID=A0A4C1ZWU5_EUMVA|nr:hypothetical protein EVAR_65909_1 [Eumeta japonica]
MVSWSFARRPARPARVNGESLTVIRFGASVSNADALTKNAAGRRPSTAILNTSNPMTWVRLCVREYQELNMDQSALCLHENALILNSVAAFRRTPASTSTASRGHIYEFAYKFEALRGRQTEAVRPNGDRFIVIGNYTDGNDFCRGRS